MNSTVVRQRKKCTNIWSLLPSFFSISAPAGTGLDVVAGKEQGRHFLKVRIEITKGKADGRQTMDRGLVRAQRMCMKEAGCDL